MQIFGTKSSQSEKQGPSKLFPSKESFVWSVTVDDQCPQQPCLYPTPVALWEPAALAELVEAALHFANNMRSGPTRPVSVTNPHWALEDKCSTPGPTAKNQEASVIWCLTRHLAEIQRVCPVCDVSPTLPCPNRSVICSVINTVRPDTHCKRDIPQQNFWVPNAKRKQTGLCSVSNVFSNVLEFSFAVYVFFLIELNQKHKSFVLLIMQSQTSPLWKLFFKGLRHVWTKNVMNVFNWHVKSSISGQPCPLNLVFKGPSGRLFFQPADLKVKGLNTRTIRITEKFGDVGWYWQLCFGVWPHRLSCWDIAALPKEQQETL